MKKLILIAAIIASAMSCTNKKTAQIIGTFAGADKDTVTLEIMTTRDKKIIDSVVTSSKGEFKFKINTPNDNPTFYNIKFKNNTIPLIISRGEKIVITSLGDIYHNYVVEGSNDSKLLKEFNTLYNDGVAALDSLSNAFSAPNISNEERQNTLAKYSEIYFKLKRDHITFIVSNPSSMSALYALYQRLPNDNNLFSESDDLLYYRLIADSLSNKYPTSPHVISLKQDVESRNQAADLASRINQNIQTPINFPEIELPDSNNKLVKLSSLEGKVILIDFWSIADQRSSILNAELKEIHNQLANKGLVIYQISLDNVKIDWMNSVKRQRLPWINVIDQAGTAGKSAMSYNVKGVPSNIIIDKKGTIVARNIFGDALKNKLTELTK